MIIIGNIGRPPEDKTTKGGRAYKVFSVAESWGKEDDRTTNWFQIAFFGDVAQLAGFDKGVRVEVQGDLKIKVLDNKPFLDLMSSRAKLAPLPPKKDGDNSKPAGAAQGAAANKPASQPAQTTQAKGVAGAEDPFNQDDDIPF